MNINPFLVFRKEFDGSGLLFHSETGETCGLNPTSTLLWECFARGLNEAEALRELARHVNALPESAADDIHEFVIQLREKHFID